jgi:hypothetical protein
LCLGSWVVERSPDKAAIALAAAASRLDHIRARRDRATVRLSTALA